MTKDKMIQNIMNRMSKRSEDGIKKFGNTMNESKKPTINWIDDVQEEMWDSIVYLEKLKTILKEEKKDFLEEAEKEKKDKQKKESPENGLKVIKNGRKMYKPLPDSLVIRSSGIEGQGLFAKEKIEARTSLGVTHIKLGKKIIRTPLGGFINHSDDPNCVKTSTLVTNNSDITIKHDYKQWNLFTIKDIKKGEELTLEYSFYKI